MLALDEIKSSCVIIDGSLRSTLLALNGPAQGMAFVVDQTGVLEGVVTDGDMRRALINRGSLDAPVASYMSRAFVSVDERATREQVFNLMQCRHLKHVPVVDASHRILGVYLVHEMLGSSKRDSAAVVFCGGFGKRLRPITEFIPKPMVRVGGRPILERIVLQLVAGGISKIFLAVHYLSDMIEGYFGDGSAFGCKINYLREKSPLGTAGALGLLRRRDVIESPLIALNGDLQADFEVGVLLDSHALTGADVTMALRHYSHEVPFGCVDVKNGWVTGIEEKPCWEKLVNAGIYVLSPEVVRSVRPEPSLMTDLLKNIVSEGGRIHGIEIDGEWIDVGNPEELSRAKSGEA